MTDFVVLDTTVVSRLTKPNERDDEYKLLVRSRFATVSFQTEAELLSARFSAIRQARLDSLLNEVTVLVHQHETSVCYAAVSDARRALKKSGSDGSDAADSDVWIVASALEHSLPLISHDRQQVVLARTVGVATYTTIPTLREANPA